MSLGVPQAYHVLSSASICAFLTAQDMFLMLWHLERTRIKFLRLVAPSRSTERLRSNGGDFF